MNSLFSIDYMCVQRLIRYDGYLYGSRFVSYIVPSFTEVKKGTSSDYLESSSFVYSTIEYETRNFSFAQYYHFREEFISLYSKYDKDYLPNRIFFNMDLSTDYYWKKLQKMSDILEEE